MSWQSPQASLMESKMNSCFFLLLLLQLCGMSGAPVRYYTLIPQLTSETWFEAQSICREKYTDLVSITSDEEQNQLQSLLSSAGSQQVTKWIGLSKTQSYTWEWSDGETPAFFKWSSPPGTGYCVVLTSDGWSARLCRDTYEFLCYTRVILVKENKTWEEALEYCRTHHRTLLTLKSDWRLQLSGQEASPGQTASVWTGLRFIDGKWWWVSGDMCSNGFLPDICPAPRYRCGAHNSNSHFWENRDCTEKLNFLCS